MSSRVLVVAALMAVMVGGAAQGQTGKGLAFERAEHLRRGVNLSHFYAQTRDIPQARLDAYMSVADMQALKARGFDHVRLSINPELLVRQGPAGMLRPEAMASLDRTVQQLQDAGLNVILDIHAEEAWKVDFLHGDQGAAKLCAFWMQFAEHYAKSDPEHIFFEVLNEPSMDDLYRWEGIQARAVAVIRRAAPRHTIIATAAGWGHQYNLIATEPVRDENVIYTFHDYDPMIFTHQGATWSTPMWASLHGVPYPSTPENVGPVVSEGPDAADRLQLERYGYDRWDAQRVDMEIAVAAKWGEERGVPVYCGEFGAFKKFSDAKMRVAWIADTRAALERHHVGWAMWDFEGDFGLAEKTSGGIVYDEDVMRALGMGK